MPRGRKKQSQESTPTAGPLTDEQAATALTASAAGPAKKGRGAAKKGPVSIVVPTMKIRTFQVDVRGTSIACLDNDETGEGSVLVSHAWSEKAIQEMLDKQMGKPKSGKKVPKDPWKDYVDSLYWLSPKPENPTEDDVKKAVFGFKALAFKCAMVSACRNLDDVPMTFARGAFHVLGDTTHPEGAMVKLQIDGKPCVPVMRRDMVRIQMSSDIRFRGQFSPWGARLTIRYNDGVIKPEHIINLLNVAGFAVGVGEARAEKNGEWGGFTVVGKIAELEVA